MVVGLGIDIVEVDRIREAMENPRFVYRVLTDMERELCKTPSEVAGRWAAKEAVFKAVGLPLGWQEIEILPDELGIPSVTIHSNEFDLKRLRLKVSISHERRNAVAVAILERVVLHSPLVS